MSLNALEYDKLSRMVRATEQLANNSGESVSLERYLHLDGVCRQLGAIARQREDERDHWKRECGVMQENRDQFKAWGFGVVAKLETMELRAMAAEANLQAMEQRAVAAEAELAALKASLGQSNKG